MGDVGAQLTADILKYAACPHCGTKARLEEHSEFRWICGVCGGPRVPVEDEAAHSDREREELVRANGAKKMAFAYRAAGIALSLMGALLAALGGALAIVSAGVALALMAVAAVALVTGIVYVRRANRKHDEAKRATFEAWESVAEALLVARGREVTAQQIAKEMHTSTADVERMMSFLSVDDRVRIVVKDTDLVYAASNVATNTMALEDTETANVEAERQMLESEEHDADAADTAGADQRRR
ncbi:MAG TPA: hypothetical protein VNO21_11745 [Polyangiaceae bacterium]|nr:hypothetical protein [Polyangiaceae bacterium]